MKEFNIVSMVNWSVRISAHRVFLLLMTSAALQPRNRAAVDAAATLTVSQCSVPAGPLTPTPPRITLHCPSGHAIHISRSFHGSRPPNGVTSARCSAGRTGSSGRCSYCDGDCVDESVGVVYDWSSTCTGRQSCTRTVLQSHMPAHCGVNVGVVGNTTPTPAVDSAVVGGATTGQQQQPKSSTYAFSEYLQVDYDCVDKSQIIDVCGGLVGPFASRVVRTGGHVVSPGYMKPAASEGSSDLFKSPTSPYPMGIDCLCRLELANAVTVDRNLYPAVAAAADRRRQSARIHVAIYDMALDTKQDRCHSDWVMIRAPNGEKHRHCGLISTGSKMVTSSPDRVDIQFHSDNVPDVNNTLGPLSSFASRPTKGFWMHFFATPSDMSVRVTCRKLDSLDPEVVEISHDDVSERDITTESSVHMPPATQVSPLSPSQGGSEKANSREARLSFFSGSGKSIHSTHGVQQILLTLLLGMFARCHLIALTQS